MKIKNFSLDLARIQAQIAGRKLGIYLGKDRISAVELSGRHIVRQASLAVSKPQDNPAAIQDFLRENKFTTREVRVGLSSKDLFIRGFQMPLLGRQEIDSGINYEVKKYLPFRNEDLVFDYQYRINKALDKTDIFYIASSKNNFDKYLDLFKQAGIQVRMVESASLALFRLLLVTQQFDPKQTIMIAAIQDDLDIEFSVVSRGFPCFSRDVKLSLSPSSSGRIEDISPERLSSEIRVFLDYFKRQFSVSEVDRIVFAAKNINLDLIAGLNKNLGLQVQILEQSGDPELNALRDLDSLKAYAVALKGAVKMDLAADLLRRQQRQPVILKEAISLKSLGPSWGALRRPLILATILIALAYAFPLPEQMKTAKDLTRIKAQAEDSLPPAFRALDLEGLHKQRAEYKKKLPGVKDLINSRVYLTGVFNILPKAVKDGLWIEALEISQKGKLRSLSLKGGVCLGDAGRELRAVKDLLKSLKESPDFSGEDLSNLEIKSTSRNDRGEHKITVFEISM